MGFVVIIVHLASSSGNQQRDKLYLNWLNSLLSLEIDLGFFEGGGVEIDKKIEIVWWMYQLKDSFWNEIEKCIGFE